MKDTFIGVSNGWSEEKEETTIKSLDKLVGIKGFFYIKGMRGEHYWYFRVSNPKRDIYLGKVSIGFDKASNVLYQKVSGNEPKYKKSRKLDKIIQEYIDTIWDRANSINGDMNITSARTKVYSLQVFQKWSKENDIRLQMLEGQLGKKVYKSFFEHLVARGMKKGTMRGYLTHVRMMIKDLSKDKTTPYGWELIKNNVLDASYQTDLLSIITEQEEDGIIKEYKDEYYKKVVELCINKVRDVWEEYCKNGGILYAPLTSRGVRNKRNNSLGYEVVFFVSLIQILTGMRLKEVLHSYKSREAMERDREDRKIPSNRSYSYWSYDEDEGIYVITIKMKRKVRRVPIREYIYSSVKPPEGVRYTYEKYKKKVKGKSGIYKTDLLDVIMTIQGENGYYLFPSDRDRTTKTPRSLSNQHLIFRKMVKEEGLDRYGIYSSHHLRSYFISYMIRQEGITPLILSELAGHSMFVMEQRYKRENMQSKYKAIVGSNYTTILNKMGR